MSQNRLHIIPTSPGYIPSAGQQAAVLVLVRELAPAAKDVTVVRTDDVVFIDAGSNFSAIPCPCCGEPLEVIGWWQHEMSRCFEQGSFSDLSTVTPCCDGATTLNELVYEWPQGFARWRVEVQSPARTLLDPSELDALTGAMGHEIREIWTHL